MITLAFLISAWRGKRVKVSSRRVKKFNQAVKRLKFILVANSKFEKSNPQK